MISPGGLTIAGEAWRPEELAAVVEAARALLRSCRGDGTPHNRADPLRLTVAGRPLWSLAEAVDGPAARRELAERIARGDAVAD